MRPVASSGAGLRKYRGEKQMKCAYSTNIGARRKVNQDACLAATIENRGRKYYVFAVADGLGGHLSGEVASQMCVDYIRNNFSKLENYSDYNEVNQFINAINAQIVSKSQECESCKGMATTLTMCILDGYHLEIVHIGDSRAYRIHDKTIEQLTKDHSLVQVLVDEGKITKQEASTHPQKNVITRALGTDEYIQADFFSYELNPGDVVLICSDGLYNMVKNEAIRSIVVQNPLEESVKELIDLANYNGGMDNITVVLFEPEEKGVTGHDK